MKKQKAYFVGAGIASLAGAAFLLRDGKWSGENICIFDSLSIAGGSCDGIGNAQKGYVIRGGRMLNEPTYECTWSLLNSLPSLDDSRKSVLEEIKLFNEMIKTKAKARLVNSKGEIVDVNSMGFSNKDRFDMAKMLLTPEENMGNSKIDDWFSQQFFTTNFWYMWATTFAFQPWHSAVEFKRYLLRFMHEFPRIQTLAGVTRTPYNQYDSLILPLISWLKKNGVIFKLEHAVTDVKIKDGQAMTLEVRHQEEKNIIDVSDALVFIINGSMTDGAVLGSMQAPPPEMVDLDEDLFSLWKKIIVQEPNWGNPKVFADEVNASLWESFTVTLNNKTFFECMERFSGNKPGTGALVTFKDSSWFMSIVLAHQPHFRNQPENIQVFWGYSLFPDRLGDYVKKPMLQCNGEEIMHELCSHLHFNDQLKEIMDSANCIPCVMPYITSQFMPRKKGDRPDVIPENSKNIAFIGQFAEIADDVVFTVEYSVRTAQIAVYHLLDLAKEVPPIHQYQYDIRTLFQSFITSFR